MLEAAFGWVSAGLTGVSAGAFGAVGGAAALGGYSLWAADNPEDAAEFQQYLAENVVSQNVGSNQQLAMNLQTMPDSVKESIITYVSDIQVDTERLPSTEGITVPVGLNIGLPSEINANPSGTADIRPCLYSGLVPSYLSSGKLLIVYQNISRKYYVKEIYELNNPVVSFFGTYIRIDGIDGNLTGTKHAFSSFGDSVSDTALDTSFLQRDCNSGTNPVSVIGLDLGAGFMNVPTMSGVNPGLTSAFDNFVAGIGTAADVAIAGGVEAVYLPNVAINDGMVTVDDTYDVSEVTYPDIAITIDGGGGTVPVPTDVLTALQQIIGLLTPMGIISGLPPIVQDIEDKMGTIVDEWPGVMDILDGLGLLPPIVQDIADGMGVIIDIPQSLEDITDILLPIPQSLQGLLDGVTIDIPQTLAQILNGTLSIPTAIDGVISGVAEIPAAIAGALDIDWVLDNTTELKDRLPDLDAPLILPQATFDDLKGIANDYKERTPLGKIFEAYEGTFDVMSTSPQGAPRYEITFPPPIDFSFVIDFAVFDGLFVQLAHAFFYLLAIFWYLKFIKRVKSWIDSWLTLGGGFAEVAEEESYAFRE